MQGYIDIISQRAYEALIEEVDTTPKPGLVDKNGSGAHTDMDYQLFVKSADAIKPYLRQFALAALGCNDVAVLAKKLKAIGIDAENAMLCATSGINTHKGAIFALGMVIGALVSKKICNTTSVSGLTARIKALATELSPMRENDTHGAAVCRAYNIGGAFGQALCGYDIVIKPAINDYKKFAELGLNDNDANIMVLLRLMSTLDDTNVYHRVGKEGYQIARSKAAALLDNFAPEALNYLCMNFNTNNISFGGSADMLMLSIFTKKLVNDGFLVNI